MRTSKRTAGAVLVLALSLLCAGPLRAQPPASGDAERTRLARELISLTGADKIGQLLVDALLTQFKPQVPTAPAAYWSELQQSFKPEEVVDLVVPIYTRLYTADELDALLAFYRTPVGQKVIATLPAMVQESMSAGMQWGQQKAQDVVVKLQADGYQPAPGAPSAQ